MRARADVDEEDPQTEPQLELVNVRHCTVLKC